MSTTDQQMIIEGIENLGVPAIVTDAAVDNIIGGRVHLLALTGKLASGKDTVGRLAIESAVRAAELSGPIRRVSFGAAIVADCEQLIQSLNRSAELPDAVRRAATSLNLPARLVRPAVELLLRPVQEGSVSSALQRSPIVRQALQLVGDARREISPDHWVRTGLVEAVRAVAGGASVYVPDVRTVAEAEGVRRIGCLLARIECDERTRVRRLAARDGIQLDERVTTHQTETALDGYPGIDLRVSNDAEDDLHHPERVPPVRVIVGALLAHRSRLSEGTCHARR